MADWSELKRLAEAAAQGKYESKQDWDDGDLFNVLAPGELRVKAGPVMKTVATCNDPEQAEFFAAANPAALLELIAENEVLKTEIEVADRHWANESNNVQTAVAEIVRIKAERDQLAERLSMYELIHGGRASELVLEIEHLHAEVRRLKIAAGEPVPSLPEEFVGPMPENCNARLRRKLKEQSNG